ncbi:SGNH/GDSL hydrolase family protein [Thermodesulfobacteriota bacterium]
MRNTTSIIWSVFLPKQKFIIQNLSLLLILLGGGCAHVGGDLTRAAIGDSITAGEKSNGGWCTLLDVDNYGVSSELIDKGLLRLYYDVILRQYDVVYMSHGTAQGAKHWCTLFEGHYRTMALAIIGSGSELILLDTIPTCNEIPIPDKSPAWGEDIKYCSTIINRIGDDYNIKVIHFNELGGEGCSKRYYDHFHPNTAGYEIMADIIRRGSY